MKIEFSSGVKTHNKGSMDIDIYNIQYNIKLISAYRIRCKEEGGMMMECEIVGQEEEEHQGGHGQTFTAHPLTGRGPSLSFIKDSAN